MTDVWGRKLVAKFAANTFDCLQLTGPKVEYFVGQEAEKGIMISVWTVSMSKWDFVDYYTSVAMTQNNTN